MQQHDGTTLAILTALLVLVVLSLNRRRLESTLAEYNEFETWQRFQAQLRD